MILRLFFLLCTSYFILSCAPTAPPVVTRKPSPVVVPNQSYDEDLSAVRPRYKDNSTVDNSKKPELNQATNTSLQPVQLVNKQVDAILDTISIHNKALRFAVGYRIQIYAGNVRTDADAAKLFVYQNYPELLPYIVFTSPTYRVKIGDFMNKLDAERYLQQVRQQFASAIILSEKIDLKKSLLVK